jgi:uncharacterized protein
MASLFCGSCRWFYSRRLSDGAKEELINKIKGSVAKSGGMQTWTRVSPSPFAPKSLVDTLATSTIYRATVSAIRQEGEKNGLRIQMQETRAEGGLRTASMSLWLKREPICKWRVREVRRLLRAAIVIDDLGEDLQAAQRLLALPYPVTLSVMPNMRSSAETAEGAYHARREVMLHLPMEADPGPHVSAGKGIIRIGMGKGELQDLVESDLASVPHVAGVNNHMGSRATTNFILMASVMRILAERHLYFIDSRTTSDTVALDAARRNNVPAFYRSVFLDDTQTVPYTLEQLRRFRRIVEDQGAALAIGHPHPSTLEALENFLPELERDDIQLLPPSALVRLPEVARLWPPRPKS